MEIEEKARKVKHSFMVYRNGVVADALRPYGKVYRVIFGLQLPQISAIARETGKNRELADWLWNDNGVRESRLLAPYLWNADDYDTDGWISIAGSVQTVEEADILCFRLLRYHPEARGIADALTKEEGQLPQYCATALLRNLDNM